MFAHGVCKFDRSEQLTFTQAALLETSDTLKSSRLKSSPLSYVRLMKASPLTCVKHPVLVLHSHHGGATRSTTSVKDCQGHVDNTLLMHGRRLGEDVEGMWPNLKCNTATSSYL